MDKQIVNLYFIMGTVNLAGRDPLHVLEGALKGGVTSFQLREKGPGALTGEELKAFALACQQLCEQYSVPFIVNDDIDLAVDVGADGIRLGPVYETQTKTDTQPVIGIETIREVASLLPGLPIVAIGGISERRANAIIKAGASGVAVISAILGEEDPREAASRLKGAVLLSLTGIEM